TLANAPCGWLARHFQVTGPNYTFTGKAEALYSAFSQAADDLNKARIVSAWVIAVDFAQKPSEKTLFAALRLALAAPGASDHKPVSWLSGPRSSGTSILFKQKETLAGRYLNV
ncbi:MAG TPA: hypothetical protein PKL15_03345, partial [Saprospiraceae bacterium]|nr:hypothetical protein [Saprospiraceae bacterium]